MDILKHYKTKSQIVQKQTWECYQSVFYRRSLCQQITSKGGISFGGCFGHWSSWGVCNAGGARCLHNESPQVCHRHAHGHAMRNVHHFEISHIFSPRPDRWCFHMMGSSSLVELSFDCFKKVELTKTLYCIIRKDWNETGNAMIQEHVQTFFDFEGRRKVHLRHRPLSMPLLSSQG